MNVTLVGLMMVAGQGNGGKAEAEALALRVQVALALSSHCPMVEPKRKPLQPKIDEWPGERPEDVPIVPKKETPKPAPPPQTSLPKRWVPAGIIEAPIITYGGLRKRAIVESRPLVVWVGVEDTSCEAEMGDYLHWKTTWFEGVGAGPAVVVGVPLEGDVYRVIVPARGVAAGPIRRAVQNFRSAWGVTTVSTVSSSMMVGHSSGGMMMSSGARMGYPQAGMGNVIRMGSSMGAGGCGNGGGMMGGYGGGGMMRMGARGGRGGG